jgi:PAS domain S-box-containing protein
MKPLRTDRRQSAGAPAGTRAGDALDYRRLFDLNPHPMWIFDLRTLEFLDVNEAATRHYGYSRHEFLERTLRDIRPSEDIPRLARRVSKISDRPTTRATRWRHRKKDGSLIDVEVTSFSVTFLNRPARVVTVSDVTDRLRAEDTIRALLHTVTRAEEEERIRFARELHDDTAQSLSLLLLGLRKIAEARTLDDARISARDLRIHIARAIGEELCDDHEVQVDVQVSGLAAPLPAAVVTHPELVREANQSASRYAADRTADLKLLSLRERQVLQRVAEGLTNREVAEQLQLSIKSVEAYRARLMSKLGLKTRAELVRYTLECGLLRLPPARK